jgi:NhaP-type Na+/H+ or K+/H+ antiporter
MQQGVRFARNYLLIALLIGLAWILSPLTEKLVGENIAHMGGNAQTLLAFFEAIVVLVFGFLTYELAKPTVLPSFVLTIFIGMLERSTLMPLISNPATLGVLTTLGAALILFGGGLETPFHRFKKLIIPILSIAFLGTIITAVLLSVGYVQIASHFAVAPAIGAAVLLGAALASTDPAAIIPSLKILLFRNPRPKDIAISESAINDVVGAVLTGVFLSLLLGGMVPASIGELYRTVLSAQHGIEVLKELAIGCAVGIVGFGILHFWSKWKSKMEGGGEADAALFLAVPLMMYVIATMLHGSGFLAVFIAGLLFELEDHVSHVTHYFNHTIEGFMKPLIFMLLGASVDIHALLSIAPLGITIGVFFILIVRPIAVFATLSPFLWIGKSRMNVRELLFLSFVRETGVIPAVLLMGIGISGIPGTETVVLVGLWIILLTLIIQPPLTPLVAKLLRVAETAPPFPLRKSKGPTAVLCSRGDSYMGRIDAVIAWADLHSVQSVSLLHCPEGKYSDAYIRNTEHAAMGLFAKLNEVRERENKTKLVFEFIGRPGLLHDNIEAMVAEGNVSIVFVGSKMLDYRMEDVKRLQVPFVFLP